MRRQDWPERLIDTIGRHAAMPFGLGVSDCFVMPMDCVLAMTGRDPWADQRGYFSEIGAARRLRAKGFADVGDAFAAALEEIPPAFAQRGDLGVVHSPRGIAGVVFVGAGVVGKAEHGIAPYPRSLVLRAFRV